MQEVSLEKAGVPQSEWWAAGTAPLLEIIPAEDPFKPRDHWNELRSALGARVKTSIVEDASHALFPEQPKAIVEATVGWTRALPV